MITTEIRKFIEAVEVAWVASADTTGHPHLAAGRDLKVEGRDFLLFENWFCETTMRNVSRNPNVAVSVTTPDMRGYQFIGTMNRSIDEAILNGYVPDTEKPGMPQVLVRMVVQVRQVMEFSAGPHTDLPVE